MTEAMPPFEAAAELDGSDHRVLTHGVCVRTGCCLSGPSMPLSLSPWIFLCASKQF
jgi:hypothetical protein